jgi:hypothetical protein
MVTSRHYATAAKRSELTADARLVRGKQAPLLTTLVADSKSPKDAFVSTSPQQYNAD